MHKLISILAFLIAVIFPYNVEAQNPTLINLLEVDILPEYDQPGVLMIYHITLPSDTNLPASLEIRIPSNAQINAVAFLDPSDLKLFDTPYDKTVQGHWSVIKLTTPTLQVQLEFYAPLVKDGNVRHIIFEWGGDFQVRNLEVNFHKPLGAENVSISMAPTKTSLGQDGLMVYHLQKDELGAGEAFRFTIDYQRQTDDLNISNKPPQAVSTPGPDTPGHVSMNDVLPWILGGIGVLLLAAGIVAIFMWQRAGLGSAKGKKTARFHNKRIEESTYCHQCGKRAQPGDLFCRTCGTRLKRGTVK